MLLLFWRPRPWPIAFGLISVFALALIVAACGEGEEEAAITDMQRSPDTLIVIPAGEPIVIGVSTALTGPARTRGTQYRNAVIVGVERWEEANGDEIAGHSIEVRAEDDGCSASGVTATAAERLLRVRGLVGVIGPQCSTGSAAAIPIYAKAGVVMVSGSATRTDLTLNQPQPKFFFRTAYTNAQEAAEQARYVIARLEVDTVYIIDNSELYGQDLADAAQAALEDKGRKVTRLSIVQGAVDFSELAARVAADSPDLVIFEGFNPEGALLYRQLRDAGYGGPFISGDGVASVSDFIEPLGEQAEGVVLAGCSPTLAKDFLDDYDAIIGGMLTTAFPAHYADAVTILLDAVAQVAVEQPDGSLVIDPLQLREAVSKPQLLAGLSGAIAFDQNGDRVGHGQTAGLTVCVVKGGEFVSIRF